MAAGVVSSIIVILAETEWERFLQYFAFLDFWIVSFVLLFVGWEVAFC